MYDLQTKVNTKIRVGYQLIDNPRFKVVKDNLPSRIDPAGYVDPNIKIQEAMKSGIRIEELQKAIYDYNNPDREIWREEDDDYVNMDIYKSEMELLEEGYHSLEIYRKKMRDYYDNYLVQKDSRVVPQEGTTPSVVDEKSESETVPVVSE